MSSDRLSAEQIRDRNVIPPAVLERCLKTTPGLELSDPPADLVRFFARSVRRTARPEPARLMSELFAHSRKRDRLSCLHLVPALEFPFKATLTWESNTCVGLTVPVAPNADWPDPFEQHVPDVIAVDVSLQVGKLPAPKLFRLSDSFRTLYARACADMATTCSMQGKGAVWIVETVPDRATLLRSTLAAQGIEVSTDPRATGAQRILMVGAPCDPWLSSVRAGDAVILATIETPWSLIDQVRAQGWTVLRPPIAGAIAARLGFLVSLHRDVSVHGQPVEPGLQSPGKLVDPLVVPERNEIVADLSTTVPRVLQTRLEREEEIGEAVARHRLRDLASGKAAL
jgi:hypothetical protein